MSDPTDWAAGNERFLAAVLHWLRLLLEWHATARGAPPITPAPPFADSELAPARGGWFGRSSPAPPPPPLALPAPQGVTQEQVEEAATAARIAENMPGQPALYTLAQRLGLSRFEQNVLLLCAALELDTRIPRLCAQVQGDPAMAYPTFALALAIFDEPAWSALAPEGGLRAWRLLEIAQPP
ncbi:MAG: ATP-binding protein, partial [Thermomicrobiales bacterium]